VTPAVRAAFYQMLADLPGIRSLGQQRLVIDPGTGLPLAPELRYLKVPAGQAWSAPGGLFSYEVFGTARWTNATPPDYAH
jgi:hypothetical protein